MSWICTELLLISEQIISYRNMIFLQVQGQLTVWLNCQLEGHESIQIIKEIPIFPKITERCFLKYTFENLPWSTSGPFCSGSETTPGLRLRILWERKRRKSWRRELVYGWKFNWQDIYTMRKNRRKTVRYFLSKWWAEEFRRKSIFWGTLKFGSWTELWR